MKNINLFFWSFFQSRIEGTRLAGTVQTDQEYKKNGGKEESSEDVSKKETSFFLRFFPLGILFAGVLLTLAATIFFDAHYKKIKVDQLSQFSERIELVIRGHLREHIQALADGSATLALIDFNEKNLSVNRTQFAAYFNARKSTDLLPGAKSMGFIERSEKLNDQKFIEHIKQSDDLNDFELSSFGEKISFTDRYVVRHFESTDQTMIVRGLDLGSNLQIRQDIERSVRTGKLTLSKPMVPVQKIQKKQSAQESKENWTFSLLMPIYRPDMAANPTEQQRYASLRGVLFIPLQVGDLLGYQSPPLRDFIYEIKLLKRDGSQSLVYDSLENGMGNYDGGLGSDSLTGNVSFGASQVDGRLSFEQILNKHHIENIPAGPLDTINTISVGDIRLTVAAHINKNALTKFDEYAVWVVSFFCLVCTFFAAFFGRIIQRTFIARNHEKQIMVSQIKRLDAVAGMTTNGVVICNLRRRIIWVNKGFERITGYSSEEVMGKSPGSFLQSESSDPLTIKAMRYCLNRAMPFVGEITNKRKNGDVFRVAMNIEPLISDDGQHEGFMAIAQNVTNEHESREELKKERFRLTSIIDGTNSGTWEWNVQTGELIFNKKWADITGFTFDEVQNMPMAAWIELLHPDDAIACEKNLKRHFKGLTFYYESEARMRRKNGLWMWVHTHARVSTRTPDGKVQWITGIHQNITKRKLDEENAVKNTVLLHGAIDAIGEAFAIYSPNDKLVFFNEKYRQTYDKTNDVIKEGVRFEDIVRHGVVNGQYPDAAGQEEQWIATRLDAHRQESYNGVQNIRGDKVIRVVERRLPDGHTVAFHMDITETLKSEAAQKAQQISEKTMMRLKAIYDIIPVGLTIVDHSGRIISCNTTSEQIFGIDKDEVIKRDLSDTLGQTWNVYNEDGTPVVHEKNIVTRALQTNAPVYDELIEVVLPHRKASLLVSAMPIEDEIMGAVVAYVDVTEQRAQRKALIDAKQFAEQANQSKSQFLANMSHEIRTPMNAILGMLSLLQKTDMSLSQSEYAAKTESAARSLLGLLNDILDFSKVEAGKMALYNQVFEVDSVLQNLSVILSANASGKQIELIYEIDPALPKHLIGDAMRLQQILINLGGNAVKFTKQGEIIISVRCLARTQEKVTVEFSIRDHGIGIALENQSKIFEGFTQAEASTTRRYGGTGLGVAICQRLVTLMGGKLQLESELGRGSRFFFQVELLIGTAQSLARQNEEALYAEDAEYAKDAGEAVSLAVRTLIIDDSPTARSSLEASVKSLGWTSQSVDSGEKALELVSSHPHAFDMILVDWTMPGINGWETCRRLKLDGSGLGAAKLFMVTAQGRDMLATRSLQEQDMLTGFVVKPVTPKMLSEARKIALLEEGFKMSSGDRTGRRDLAALSARRLEGVRILLVEDNALNQQVARELLEHKGAHLRVVNNGLAAVVALGDSATAYDVVLMDLQMPVMDGFTATKRIRTELGLTALPIIAMTANAMEHDREACLQSGMNAHVGKPFDLDHLVSTILRVTGKTKPSKHMSPPSKEQIASRDVDDLSLPGGVDLDGALARMGGNVQTYNRLLRNFLDDLPVVQAAMRACLSRGEWSILARHAHTVKGLCGTLGIIALADLSSASEEVFLSQDAGDCESQLGTFLQGVDRLSGPLEEFSKSISNLQDEQIPLNDASIQPINRQTMVQCVKDLCALLKELDMEAVTAIEHIRTLAWGEQRAEIQSIDHDVIALNFEDALVKCNQFLTIHDKL